jgi:hypothetical protein
MADIKISELLPASTPLTGAETLPIVQSGNTLKATTQDIADLYSLGYTAEDVANKSTDSSFAGATDINYPSQLAVKTYVDNTLANSSGWSLSGNSGTTSANFIGTTDNKNLNLKVNNNTALTLDAATGYVDVKSKLRINVSNTVYAQLDVDSNKGRLLLYNSSATSTASLNCNNLTTSRTLQLPNTSGTLVATVNGTAPDPAGNVTISVSGGWGLTGNSGTTAGTNFIGTTDAQDVVFKANGTERMRIDKTYGDITITNNIQALNAGGSSISAFDGTYTTASLINPADSNGGYLYLTKPTGGAYLKISNLTSFRNLELPDADGTLAIVETSAFTGTKTIGGQVYTWQNGILVSVV